jgi:BASS family bile acid:Na+ symporter
MTSIILFVLKASVFLGVFTIGLNTTVANTTFLLRRPERLGRAMLSMNVLMPAIALAIAAWFDIHPAVKIALVAISVSPIPPVFPDKMLKAGGRSDYTIGLLVAASVVSIVAIPVSMEILERIMGIPLTMRPAAVAKLVLTTILLPLAAGIAAKALAPRLASRAAKPIAVLSSVLLPLCALLILIGSWRSIASLLQDGTVLSLGGFALVGIFIGHLLGGPEAAGRPVLALATVSRHPGVALAIAHANFPDEKLAVCAVLLYLVLTGILTAVYLAWNKRIHPARAPVEAGAHAEP